VLIPNILLFSIFVNTNTAYCGLFWRWCAILTDVSLSYLIICFRAPLLLIAVPVAMTSISSVISSEHPHPSAFSLVDVAAPASVSVRDWQSLPDIDRRPTAVSAAGQGGPPSPVYSNASSTCFIPPTHWSATWFGSTAPLAPPGMYHNYESLKYCYIGSVTRCSNGRLAKIGLN